VQVIFYLVRIHPLRLDHERLTRDQCLGDLFVHLILGLQTFVCQSVLSG